MPRHPRLRVRDVSKHRDGSDQISGGNELPVELPFQAVHLLERVDVDLGVDSADDLPLELLERVDAAAHAELALELGSAVLAHAGQDEDQDPAVLGFDALLIFVPRTDHEKLHVVAIYGQGHTGHGHDRLGLVEVHLRREHELLERDVI
eukprot:scaffold1858_cov261-Pinguiococcus_pyrenoidosus.AAC.2